MGVRGRIPRFRLSFPEMRQRSTHPGGAISGEATTIRARALRVSREGLSGPLFVSAPRGAERWMVAVFLKAEARGSLSKVAARFLYSAARR